MYAASSHVTVASMNAPFSRRQPSNVKLTWFGSEAASVTCGRRAVGATWGATVATTGTTRLNRSAKKTGMTLSRVQVFARESIRFSPLALAALRPSCVD